MLCGLSIRNIVAIASVDLPFSSGLSVLTGESGAGKSIVIDALGLALGWRAESGLLRPGARHGSVSALFRVEGEHPAHRLAVRHGVAADGELLLRRVLSAADGRSRAFINDEPVTVGFLRSLGTLLVEIEGQFSSQGLLEPAHHRGVVDAFGGCQALHGEVEALYRAWRDHERAAAEAAHGLEATRAQADYLRAALEELEEVAPQPGEESRLVEKRRTLVGSAQIVAKLTAARADFGGGLSDNLERLRRSMAFLADKAPERFAEAARSVESAVLELNDVASNLSSVQESFKRGDGELDRIEERILALRTLGRKHRRPGDELHEVRNELASRLEALESGSFDLARLTKMRDEARGGYEEAVLRLRALRQAAALRLDAAVMGGLHPLKLERARFETRIEPLAAEAWGAHGGERVLFMVAFNPGMEVAPLHKVASGGELARLMLALRVVATRASAPPTLVFDEVDSGVGGAVANAVGERLAALGAMRQVLVVTHSPQVSARGACHFRVVKNEEGALAETSVVTLGGEARREEIARMLAGAQVTQEARAAAHRLLEPGAGEPYPSWPQGAE